jgi:hypothetical protein
VDDEFIRTRGMLAEVHALADQAEEDFKRWESARRVREQAASRERLVRKTYEAPQQQQRINDLDLAVQARWDAWFDSRFDKRMDRIFADAIVSTYVHEHIAKVREEIGSLRADFTLQNAVAKGEIAQLGQDKSDVAA